MPKHQPHEKQPKPTEQSQRSAKGINITKGPEFRNVYANNVQLNTSFMDVTLSFGQIVGLNQDGLLDVEQHTRIAMSPQEAKLFLLLLLQQINEYENNFGEIKLPSDPSGESKEGES